MFISMQKIETSAPNWDIAQFGMFPSMKKRTHFLNNLLDFRSNPHSCLKYSIQPSQNDWYHLKTLILALFLLFDVIDKFAMMYCIKKAISTKKFNKISALVAYWVAAY